MSTISSFCAGLRQFEFGANFNKSFSQLNSKLIGPATKGLTLVEFNCLIIFHKDFDILLNGQAESLAFRHLGFYRSLLK